MKLSHRHPQVAARPNAFFLTVLLLMSGAAFAVGETPAFFNELSMLVVASAAIAFICFRLGLTPIIGFLVAGVLIGPNALGLVQNRELIEAAAEVGVVLLLFTIGIEFSLETLARISRLIFLGGGLQVGMLVLVSTLALGALGSSWQVGVFTGFLLALSSTAIVMKLLADRNETASLAGQSALGILIFQDLAVVVMVLLVPLLGGEAGGPLELAWALAKAGGIIALVLLLARRVMPRVLEGVARTCSPEIFLLSVIAICFGTAFLTSLAGVSLSLGAFLAGLLVSESRFGQQALSEILPLQIIFSAAFFISVGLLLDLGFLVMNLPIVLGVLLVVVLVKSLITAGSVRLLGYSLGVAASSGLLLAQVGEFSFVLERAGREVGLSPAGLGEEGGQAFIAATVLLMGITPLLANMGGRLERRLNQKIEGVESVGANKAEKLHEGFADLSDHVIITGYGAGARKLARSLEAAAVPFVVATLSPAGASEAEAQGRRVVRGDYTKSYILELVGVRRARLLVVPDDQPAMAHRTVSVARGLNPDLTILAYTLYHGSVHELKEAGADHVISAEGAAAKLVVMDVLSRYEIAPERINTYLERLDEPGAPAPAQPVITLSPEQLTSGACRHLDTVQAVRAPESQVCPECVALGDSWIHLRVCLHCGQVGCCDSSKNKHARKHAEGAAHPVICSLEPGETWAYCFMEDVTF